MDGMIFKENGALRLPLSFQFYFYEIPVYFIL